MPPAVNMVVTRTVAARRTGISSSSRRVEQAV
jgi:hypothetical protein